MYISLFELAFHLQFTAPLQTWELADVKMNAAIKAQV